MSHVLYRKYRSRNFDDVLGQDHATSILKASLAQGKIAHAYLLTGPRGTGKTSVARILAHAIADVPYDTENNATHFDIIEIDAASNNGVDDIRLLQERVQIAPSAAAKKVYIIDEVHMLSKSAFNAFLKTLEEPPEHVVFIMATTDVEKVPETIISRAQQFHFHPIPADIIAKRLIDIAKQEGFSLEMGAAEQIAERSHGGFRDAIGLLDQLSVLADKNQSLDEATVAKFLGLADEKRLRQLIDAHWQGDTAGVVQQLRALEADGMRTAVIIQQLLSLLRRELADNPQNATLMKQLIEVMTHPHPELKLLAVLIPSTTAQPIPPAPKMTEINNEKAPEKPKKIADSQPQKKNKKAKKPVGTEPVVPKTEAGKIIETIDKPAVIAALKEIDSKAGVIVLLNSSAFITENGTLVIYAGNAFSQKKINSAQNISLVHQAVRAAVGQDVEIIVKAEQKPPQDETTARLTEIFGGGEEITLEEEM